MNKFTFFSISTIRLTILMLFPMFKMEVLLKLAQKLSRVQSEPFPATKHWWP